MRFIEKNPQVGYPLIISVQEKKKSPPKDRRHSLEFSLTTEYNNEEGARGSCLISGYGGGDEHLYISDINVHGNTNNPTRRAPNRHVGLGQLLVFIAIKYGFDLKVKKAKLVPLEGSDGFYLKMGFHPDVTGNPNRMVVQSDLLRSSNGNLNPEWIERFSQSSFRHESFRGPFWSGDIPSIYLRLRTDILRTWEMQGE